MAPALHTMGSKSWWESERKSESLAPRHNGPQRAGSWWTRHGDLSRATSTSCTSCTFMFVFTFVGISSKTQICSEINIYHIILYLLDRCPHVLLFGFHILYILWLLQSWTTEHHAHLWSLPRNQKDLGLWTVCTAAWPSWVIASRVSCGYGRMCIVVWIIHTYIRKSTDCNLLGWWKPWFHDSFPWINLVAKALVKILPALKRWFKSLNPKQSYFTLIVCDINVTFIWQYRMGPPR